jgi:phospholipase/lecithinase/hemolysin
MQNAFYVVLSGILLGGSLLAGCAGAATSPTLLPTTPSTLPAPTVTSLPPTDTELPPTDTPLPPTDTPLPQTDTPLPPTDTPLPPNYTPPPPTDTPEPIFSNLYAFGDDFVDTGRGLAGFEEAYANGELEEWVMEAVNKTYWEGRESNGPLAVEILAEQVGAELTNYAKWGVTAGELGSPEDDSYIHGLLVQVDEFESELNSQQADPEALYFIGMGFADFFTSMETGVRTKRTVENRAKAVVTDISEAVTRLAGLGAKKFMVTNAFDFASFPGFVYEAKNAEIFQNQMNGTLPGEMEKLAQELGVTIYVFDAFAAGEHIRNNPDDYGLTNLTEACTTAPWDLSYFCENPDEYYFYVSVFPSRVVYKAMGEMMAEQVSK